MRALIKIINLFETFWLNDKVQNTIFFIFYYTFGLVLSMETWFKFMKSKRMTPSAYKQFYESSVGEESEEK